MIGPKKSQYDVLVIGGGFYGAYISEHFAKRGKSVLLCEQHDDLLQEASLINQARVHNGYHYPRSVLTGIRSRISYPKFVNEFEHCIYDSFEKYYLVAKKLSKVTSNQFQGFCSRIGAPFKPVPELLGTLADPGFVEAVFKTTECAFDGVKLKETMATRILSAGVEVALGTKILLIARNEKGLQVKARVNEREIISVTADHVFNCSYSGLNIINRNSGLDIIPLKHELVEMCLVEVPDEIKNKGITLMCGPFFSVMPFPSTQYHTFSHVRYTPHCTWYDEPGKTLNRPKHLSAPSQWKKMQRDAARYLPILNNCKYVKSLWGIKTILPSSELNDSRPILFKQNYGFEGFHCVVGGKIDNIYDAINIITSKGIGQ